MARIPRKKRRFIEEHRDLSAPELARRTGLEKDQVAALLRELDQEDPGPANGPSNSNETGSGDRSIVWMTGLLVAVVTAIVYLPALSNGFVNWDDPQAILENVHLRRLNGDFFRWAFTSFHTGNWIPLTWISHAVDYQLWHLDARMHHLTSLIWHALNTLLVFFLALRVFEVGGSKQLDPLERGDAGSGWNNLVAAAVTAALFGIHPLHVESVAWVAERKDVLYAFFFLASLLAYLRYADPEKPRARFLLLSFFLFVLSVLAKPMAVTLPVVLLLLDAWPLRRQQGLKRLLLEKIPFFAISLISGLVTIKAQGSAGAISDAESIPLLHRIMNAFHSVGFYLYQTVVPKDLIAFHPYSTDTPALTGANLIAAAVVILLTVLAIVLGGRGRPFLWVGWFYYLVTLAPVAGVMQVGAQASADRYTYLTLLGPTMLFAATAVWAQFRLDAAAPSGVLGKAKPVFIVLAVALLGLALLTRSQIKIWRDSVTLWEHVITYYPDRSQTVHTNLGNAYMKVKQPDRAKEEYLRALDLPPPHALPHDGLGRALLDLGDADGALRSFRKATELDPTYANAWRNMWFAYRKKGLEDKALEAIRQAVKVKPDFAAAHSELGISYGQLGRLKESEQALRKAIELEPDNPRFLVNLATTLRSEGKQDDAIELYQKATQLAPRMLEPHVGLAAIYRSKKDEEKARRHEEAAKAIRHGNRQRPPAP